MNRIFAMLIIIVLAGAGCDQVSVNPNTATSVQRVPSTAIPNSAVLPSESNESAKQYIKLLFPNGGETFRAGEVVKIKWNSFSIDKLYISLVKGGKEFGQMTQEGVDATAKEFSWTVPGGMRDWGEDGYKIFINNNNASNDIRDYSDGTFSIRPVTTIGSEAAKTYKNTQYGFELNYPAAWKVEDTADGGVMINPPDFKLPSAGTVNPYFSFAVTAHSPAVEEQAAPRVFGEQTGSVYAKGQMIFFPNRDRVGGYLIQYKGGVKEVEQILNTLKFNK